MIRVLFMSLIVAGLVGTVAEAQVLDLEDQWLSSDVSRSGAPERVPARFGKGWDLRGAETPIVVDPTQTFPHAFSLETWFRLEDTSGRSTLFSAPAWRRFVVTIADGSHVELTLYDRGREPTLAHHAFGYDFTPGRWYQFVVTADPEGGIRFYVNGRLAHRLEPFTSERRKSDTGLHAIGAYSINGRDAYDNFFKGLIDRPVYTGKAWTEEEVLARFEEANRTLPIAPIPAHVVFVGEDVASQGSAPTLKVATDLLPKEDPGLARMAEAAKASRVGGTIVLSDPEALNLPDYVRSQIEGDLPAEGYVLAVRPERIDVVAGDARGLLYGMDTLRQVLALPTVPQVDIYDYPEFAYRAGLLVTNNQPPASLSDGFGSVSLSETIRDFADHRINGVMVRIYNWSWLHDEENLAKAKEIVDFAKKHHVDVIPYLQCYGHAKMFTWRDIRTDHTKTIADEEVVLSGDAAAELKTPNLIITENTPVLVRLADGTEMTEGRDFEVVPGEIRTSWVPPDGVKVEYATWGRPYVHPDSPPSKVRRLAKGRIPDGATVKVTYDVAANSREYCPFSPVTHELVDDTIRRVIELADPEYLNLGMDEMWTPISREGRCCAAATDMTPAEVTRREINRTLAVAQSIKPGIKVMYWSDMLDPHQTPHWMRTWEGIDKEVAQIDRQAVMMPWYYGSITSHLWRPGASLDRFLDYGFRVVGASGHEELNQFIWADAVRTRYDAERAPGFTFTTWSRWGEKEVLLRGYEAYRQATWSPSRTPFDALLQLRVELNELGITASVAEGEWAEATANVTDVQRRRLAGLLSEAEAELMSVDADTLAEARIPGVIEMLKAVPQAKRLNEDR